ncbi:MAG TPA: hypothetical protein VGJ70_08120 [Solirubrobacteraceae bacterium]|jgi:pimeloyl-ACP methyl ester carboxylesterase
MEAGDRPLVVVSGDRPGAFTPDFPTDLAARVSALVRACQRELAGLSSRGVHVVAPRSGHMVQLDEPDVVVRHVRRVAEAVPRP